MVYNGPHARTFSYSYLKVCNIGFNKSATHQKTDLNVIIQYIQSCVFHQIDGNRTRDVVGT